MAPVNQNPNHADYGNHPTTDEQIGNSTTNYDDDDYSPAYYYGGGYSGGDSEAIFNYWLWSVTLGCTLIGALLGGAIGFSIGGVGGAIVFAVIGAIIGVIVGVYLAIAIPVMLACLIGLAVVGAIIWGIVMLWGVGKPPSMPQAAEDAGAFNNRGRAWHEKGKYDDAIKDYTEAIRLNPKLAPAYSGRAAGYRELGDEAKAARDERKAQELSKGTEKVTSQKGRTTKVPPSSAKEPTVRPPQPESLRIWTSSDGNYTVEATLLKYENRLVSIQKPDGKIVEMDIGRLSKADQDYIFVEMARPRP